VNDNLRNKVYQFLDAALPTMGLTRFPAQIEALLERFMVAEYGPQYLNDTTTLNRLGSQLESIWNARSDGNRIRWKPEAHLAYLIGMAALDFHKVPHVLKQIFRNQGFPTNRPIRILDVGAGPGIAAWSTLFFFELLANAREMAGIVGDERRVEIELHHLDSSPEALDLYRKLVHAYKPGVPHFSFDLGSRLQIQLTDQIRVADLLGHEEFDLIIFSHVLSELPGEDPAGPAKLLTRFVAHLNASGSLVLVETPPMNQVHQFHRLKSLVVQQGLKLFGPCASLSASPSGPICQDCVSSQLDQIHGVSGIRRLLEAIGGRTFESLDKSNRWVWGVFRKDGAVAHPGFHDLGSTGVDLKSLIDSPDHDRVDIVVQIARREQTPMVHYQICDQSTPIESCALTFEGSGQNIVLGLGDVLHLKNVKVDRNSLGESNAPSKKIYLVVDARTSMASLVARMPVTDEVHG